MIKNVLPMILLLAVFAGCSSAYKTTQTPDDVYYSPGKVQEYAEVKTEDNRDSYDRRLQSSESEYDDYTASSEDNYLRMKIQNRYQWSALDNYDYWYSPSYAYNNYLGFNSFNPYSFNSWGLSFGYSPFASIQPYGWFNSFYPSYGFGYGYSPYSAGFYGHNYGYGYYGYSPVNVIVTSNRTRTSRPLLGGYTNNAYNNDNYNRNNGRGNRYVPINNNTNRYNNTNNSNRNNNNSVRFNNNSNSSRQNNTNNTYTPPARTYTPSSSGSSGGTVSRPARTPH